MKNNTQVNLMLSVLPLIFRNVNTSLIGATAGQQEVRVQRKMA
jgi:hypothetical protein